MKPLFQILVIGALVAVLTTLTFSAVPPMINYQGKLTDASGAPLNGAFQMVFSIYATPETLTPLWRETQDAISVEKGVFNVLLGSATPIPDSVFDGDVRYLGVKVGNDAEITPRKPMVSVAYAYTDGDWTIDGNNIYRLQGNIGIGTVTPDTNAMLTVGNFEQNARVTVRTSDLGFLFEVNNPMFPPDLAQTFSSLLKKTTLSTDDRNQIFLGFYANDDGGGSPDKRFGSAIQAVVEDPNNSTRKSGLSFLTTPSGDIRYERMRITGAGNVGIGTTNPRHRLTVEDELSVTSGEHMLANFQTGIGMDADLGFGYTADGTALTSNLIRSGNSLPLTFGTSGTNQAMIIENWGDVGIGTTNPDYKLDVEGDVQAYAYHTGDIFFQKDKKKLWRMFEDEDGLYLENLKTGKIYRFVLQEVEKK